MQTSVITALFAYFLTIACSCILAKRSSNWRIRLLAFTIALLPLTQSVILLGNEHIWVTKEMRDTAQSMELLISALGLTAVHLLNKENGDRRNTEARLRVAEAMPFRPESFKSEA